MEDLWHLGRVSSGERTALCTGLVLGYKGRRACARGLARNAAKRGGSSTKKIHLYITRRGHGIHYFLCEGMERVWTRGYAFEFLRHTLVRAASGGLVCTAVEMLGTVVCAVQHRSGCIFTIGIFR